MTSKICPPIGYGIPSDEGNKKPVNFAHMREHLDLPIMGEAVKGRRKEAIVKRESQNEIQGANRKKRDSKYI